MTSAGIPIILMLVIRLRAMRLAGVLTRMPCMDLMSVWALGMFRMTILKIPRFRKMSLIRTFRIRTVLVCWMLLGPTLNRSVCLRPMATLMELRTLFLRTWELPILGIAFSSPSILLVPVVTMIGLLLHMCIARGRLAFERMLSRPFPMEVFRLTLLTL